MFQIPTSAFISFTQAHFPVPLVVQKPLCFNKLLIPNTIPPFNSNLHYGAPTRNKQCSNISIQSKVSKATLRSSVACCIRNPIYILYVRCSTTTTSILLRTMLPRLRTTMGLLRQDERAIRGLNLPGRLSGGNTDNSGNVIPCSVGLRGQQELSLVFPARTAAVEGQTSP